VHDRIRQSREEKGQKYRARGGFEKSPERKENRASLNSSAPSNSKFSHLRKIKQPRYTIERGKDKVEENSLGCLLIICFTTQHRIQKGARCDDGVSKGRARQRGQGEKDLQKEETIDGFFFESFW